MNPALPIISPVWPAPAHIHAVTTTRQGGVSQAPWDSFNLATHVGDQHTHVQQNREILSKALKLPAPPCWLEQTHGTHVVNAALSSHSPPDADASFSTEANTVCAVMTADCLPVLFTDMQGSCIAAAHAGWRGLANGVLEATLATMPADKQHIMAWLGPAIGPNAFEVGKEVVTAFCATHAEAREAFRENRPGHYLADIYRLAKIRLNACGVSQIHGGKHCTHIETERFYSYRRDGQTGRMASLIWMDPRTS